MTKKEMQRKLDQLRKKEIAFKRGTKEYSERVTLEWRLEEHLYDKEKR